jgi:stage III sporulation protein AE
VAGAGLLRSAIGVYGMLITLAAVCLPVLRLAARWLLFRAAAAVCVGVAGERQSRLIGRLSTIYGLLLGLVGIAAAAEFLSIISLIRTVV